MTAQIIDLPEAVRQRPPRPNPFADPAVRAELITLVEKLLKQQAEHTDTLAKLLRALSPPPRDTPAG